MRRMFGLISLAVLACTACSSASPDPGQEAVVVRKPWIFGHGGVDPTPIKTGQNWVALSTQVWYVPTIPIQFTEHFDDLMSSDGVPLDFDASLRFQITDSVKIVDKFGVNDVGDGSRPYPQWYAANVVQPFRNMVRQEVRKHGMNETAINTDAIEQIDQVVSEEMTAYIRQIDLPVRLVDMTVGRANPPDAIKTQRVETATQEQRGNTERQRKLAEDQRLQAEMSRATADNAYRNQMNLSPEQFLRLEAIHMQHDVCIKGGCTFIAEGVSPVISTR
jgi:hypothetical protein